MANVEKNKAPISGLAAVSASLLETGRYSDLTIKCEGRIFQVHHIIVNPQSAPLAAHVDEEFKEAITGEIELHDDAPKIFGHLIQFLYNQDFIDGAAPTDALNDGRLITYTNVYIMADKYDIPALKKLATSKYQTAVATEWNTDSFSASLELMYTQLPDTDVPLKDVAIKAASEHVKELVERGKFMNLCKDYGEATFDILEEFLTFLKPQLGLGQCPNQPNQHRNNITWNIAQKQFCCGGCDIFFS